ncbi:hypothetical protein K440DRAFT_572241 [Wilcoxina mikolae CBS 423.85]|nr:hypothetical protein K440DRAFT_572241 [Wilcoxina mikolae CBS 423.85]
MAETAQIVAATDGTYHLNFSVQKTAWPIYMTIGNRSAAARMTNTMHSMLLVPLLPIPVKMRDVPLNR